METSSSGPGWAGDAVGAHQLQKWWHHPEPVLMYLGKNAAPKTTSPQVLHKVLGALSPQVRGQLGPLPPPMRYGVLSSKISPFCALFHSLTITLQCLNPQSFCCKVQGIQQGWEQAAENNPKQTPKRLLSPISFAWKKNVNSLPYQVGKLRLGERR